MITGPGLSADEIALYDRQIRLWGAQAQQRIRSANILLVSLRALGTEIAKNLTLAGIRSLTIIDNDPVTEEDLGTQYFIREEDVGKPRAEAAIPRIQEMNPRVQITSGGSLDELKLRNQSYYAPFDCVIACDHDFDTLFNINSRARLASRPFYAAGIHGFYGYIFADLVCHEFVIEREKSNVTTPIGPESLTRSVLSTTKRKDHDGKNIEIVKKQEKYCPLVLANSSELAPEILANRRKLKSVPALLPCLRALFEFQRAHNGRLPEHTQRDLAEFTQLASTTNEILGALADTLRSEFLRSFIQNIGAEMVPTAAFVGGRLSEDVINVLGKREQPIQNFALFDGDSLEGKIYSLYTPPPEVAMAMGNEQGLVPMTSLDGVGIRMGDPTMFMANGLGGNMT
ncbi:hypothetical protein M433DRAFT_76101 [Acidomyces richmondensis BFW]|nr:MAG: hypothetical protein FE78DRAFT_141867 [Acidomyces sp. 'richmondensis']KYG41312.1 hypothetical protein M433DRAFT_76101 [Acidomyces richmondensis BFW]